MTYGTRLTLRPGGPKDCELYYTWANDPQVRQNSFSSDLISWEEHQSWFAAKISSSQSMLFVAEVDWKPVGQLRIDLDSGIGEISISIAKDFRGNGLAKLILQRGETLVRKSCEEKCIACRMLCGRVKPDNIACRRAFVASGYQEDTKHPEYIRYSKDL